MCSSKQFSESSNVLAPGLRWEIRDLFADMLDFPNGIAASSFTLHPVENDERVIDFGFGLPDPQLFRLNNLIAAADQALRSDGLRALQYGGGSGMAKLPEWIRTVHAKRRGIPCDLDEIVVTHGSSQALDLIARVFLNAGDEVWFERPTYFGAIKIFGLRGAVQRDFPMDDQGLVVDAVVNELTRRAETGQPGPKLFYVVPNYQNPSGRSMSAARRVQLVELAQRYQFLIVEDDAYGDLGFEGQMLPTLRQLCPSHVLYLNTLSKMLAPGFRIGWILTPAPVVEKIYEIKAEGANGGFIQEVVSRLLWSIDYDQHVAHLQEHYRQRRDAMLQALDHDFGAGAQWTRPLGGFFVWLTLPDWASLGPLTAKSQEIGVSFVPGTVCYLTPGGQNQMRLSFSLYPPETITEGIHRLKRLVESIRA